MCEPPGRRRPQPPLRQPGGVRECGGGALARCACVRAWVLVILAMTRIAPAACPASYSHQGRRKLSKHTGDKPMRCMGVIYQTTALTVIELMCLPEHGRDEFPCPCMFRCACAFSQEKQHIKNQRQHLYVGTFDNMPNKHSHRIKELIG